MKKTHPLYNNWSLLAISLLIINLIQAHFTLLLDDEAYYWMFSRHLDWGYFDHPPMVAFFIKIGYSLFQNELGIRLLTVFSQVIMLRVIWQMITIPNKENYTWAFFLTAFSLPMLQIYGFFTTPDVPLLLFGSLTLLAYQQFKKVANFQHILFFSLSAAALMYSKYHGALFLIFIIASDWKLLLQPKFYLVGILAILLFSPHIYWQYINEFPSFQYHLSDRVNRQEWWFIPEYIGNQLLIYNPMMWFIFIPIFIKNTKKTLFTKGTSFQKTNYYILYGFLGFFFLTSLKMRHIEPQWTILITIPLIIITFESIIQMPKLLQRFKKLAIISIVILVLARLVLLFPILPLPAFEFDAKELAQTIEEVTEGEPVIFLDSYQKSSLQAFYSKNKFGYSYNSITAWRGNQYDYWNDLDSLNGKTAFFVDINQEISYSKSLVLKDNRTLFYKKATNFTNIQHLKLTVLDSIPSILKVGDTLAFDMKLDNPNDYEIPMDRIKLVWTLGKSREARQWKPNKKSVQFPKVLAPNSSVTINVFFEVPNHKGDWLLNWALRNKGLPMMHHSEPQQIKIIQ
ncbi:MAG: ArnT family glycosyltransferase [Saprospiraceae bacterium]